MHPKALTLQLPASWHCCGTSVRLLKMTSCQQGSIGTLFLICAFTALFYRLSLIPWSQGKRCICQTRACSPVTCSADLVITRMCTCPNNSELDGPLSANAAGERLPKQRPWLPTLRGANQVCTLQEGQFCKSKTTAPTCDRRFAVGLCRESLLCPVSRVCTCVVVSGTSTGANRLGRLAMPHHDTAFQCVFVCSHVT